MKFTVVTLFPEMFGSFLDASLLGKAREAGLLDVDFVDPRAFTADRHRTVDDAPYGGGPGMVMKAEPLLAAIRSAPAPAHRVLLAPTGAPLSQRRVRELAHKDHVLLVCGRYEGIDARVGKLIDEEISIGDFVLSGGEPAAMVLIDAVSRYVPGVLGEAASVDEESFSEGLLEYPQYTRPAEVEGEAVPPVLQGGNHEAIRRWRRAQSLARTAERRPELLARALPDEDAALLADQGLPALARRTYVALLHHPVLDRDGQLVTTSVTNLDVHDIARAAATFGLAGYVVATPIAPQREMVEAIVANWQGGARHETRGAALDRVHVVPGIEEAVARIADAHGGVRPHIVTTSARRHEAIAVVDAPTLRAERCRDARRPLLLVFGTGHGLADAVVLQSDQMLAPIEGASAFNHLSVRAAAAILLDRLFGFRIA